MSKVIKYTVFETKEGFFGLAGTELALLRASLPLPAADKAKCQLLTGLGTARYDGNLFQTAQQQITAYFEGSYVNFSPDIPILLDGLSWFAHLVLTACRDISFGQTRSYGQLAKKAGSPTAGRAVGRVMAQNPLPLIIPCHRVVRSDGKIGGFSGVGGVSLKKRMLELERRTLSKR